MERATAGLARAIDKGSRKAPGARVLLIDYLTVLDEGSGEATPFSDEEVGQLLAIQRAIGQVFSDAAARTGAELIRASAMSTDHALGSTQPWVQPFHQVMEQTGGSFHPNEAGMTAIASELERVLSV